MRNLIPVNNYLVILKIHLVLTPLSFSRNVKFPEHFKKIIEEKNYIPQQVLKPDKRNLLWRKLPCTLTFLLISSAVMLKGTA
jgi:hypothetical protein